MSAAEETLSLILDDEKIPYLREHRFHKKRQWHVDFIVGGYAAWLSTPTKIWAGEKWAVEVEGGAYPFRNKRTGELMVGRHTRGKGFEDDCEKYGELALAGYNLLRVTPAMVDDGRALAWIKRALGR